MLSSTPFDRSVSELPGVPATAIVDVCIKRIDWGSLLLPLFVLGCNIYFWRGESKPPSDRLFNQAFGVAAFLYVLYRSRGAWSDVIHGFQFGSHRLLLKTRLRVEVQGEGRAVWKDSSGSDIAMSNEEAWKTWLWVLRNQGFPVANSRSRIWLFGVSQTSMNDLMPRRYPWLSPRNRPDASGPVPDRPSARNRIVLVIGGGLSFGLVLLPWLLILPLGFNTSYLPGMLMVSVLGILGIHGVIEIWRVVRSPRLERTIWKQRNHAWTLLSAGSDHVDWSPDDAWTQLPPWAFRLFQRYDLLGISPEMGVTAEPWMLLMDDLRHQQAKDRPCP